MYELVTIDGMDLRVGDALADEMYPDAIGVTVRHVRDFGGCVMRFKLEARDAVNYCGKAARLRVFRRLSPEREAALIEKMGEYAPYATRCD